MGSYNGTTIGNRPRRGGGCIANREYCIANRLYCIENKEDILIVPQQNIQENTDAKNSKIKCKQIKYQNMPKLSPKKETGVVKKIRRKKCTRNYIVKLSSPVF